MKMSRVMCNVHIAIYPLHKEPQMMPIKTTIPTTDDTAPAMLQPTESEF